MEGDTGEDTVEASIIAILSSYQTTGIHAVVEQDGILIGDTKPEMAFV